MRGFKKLTILGVSLSFLLLAGCEEASETAKKVTDEVEEAVQAEATKDNEFVLSVQEGSLSSYPDVKMKDAFARFFSSPKWKYFQAESGEHVVEFTGYCTYMEKKVKAKLQFIVEEGKETFEIGALEFNEVPQNELTKAALIQAIYEGEGSSALQTENEAAVVDTAPTEESVSVTEESTNITTPQPSVFVEQDLRGAWHWQDGDDFYMIMRDDLTYTYIEKGSSFVSEGMYRVEKQGDQFEVRVTYSTGEYDSIMMLQLINQNQLVGEEDGYSWRAERINLSEAEEVLAGVVQ